MRKPDSSLLLGPLLVLAPTGRDAAEIERVLADMPITLRTVGGIVELCSILRPDGGASTAALMVAEEALAREADALVECLARQESWSDLPVVVLTAGGQRRGSPERSTLFAWLGNVTLLERPLRAETLRSAARAALRARARQYETRRHLEALRLAAETLEARVEERTRALAAEAVERARAEAAHRALYLRTPIPLQSLDTEGRLLSVSDRWLEFMGYGSRSEVVGRPVAEFMTKETATLHWEAYWPRLLAEDALDDIEYCLVKQSGEIADVLISARVERDAAGRFVRSMAALVDVTARRRAEARLTIEMAEREAAQERLRQAQKMEALGQLAGGVAHDFNNASAVVLAGIALLEKRYGATLALTGPSALRLLAGLHEGAERGAAISRRLLGFARRQTLNATDLDPAELLGGLRDMLGGALGPGVRLRVEAAAGLPALQADRRQLETVLINLAVNARDAMPSGEGEIAFGAAAEVVADSAGVKYPPELRPGRYVRLWAADTGVGMDAATLARAAEPFFTTKPQDRGTGLGLSMASGFAAQSGGALQLESKSGKGTTVTLWLPQAEDSTPTASAPPSAATTSRALVVEPEPLTRRFLVHCLREAGWEPAEAAGACEALALLEGQAEFDLLLVAHPMPLGLDGIELVRRARLRRPRLPTLLMVGPEAPANFAAQARHEDLQILRKPVSPIELGDALAALMQRHAVRLPDEAAD